MIFEVKTHHGQISWTVNKAGPSRSENETRDFGEAEGKVFSLIYIQSHPNTMRAYRRLSLVALACLLVG